MDFYKLSQEDFHVLEEKINEDASILANKDSVSDKKLENISQFQQISFRTIVYCYIGLV